MSIVLVTGGGGFIGRHSCNALTQQGHDVHIAQRTNPYIEGATFHECELTARDNVVRLIDTLRPDGLIHLAWTTAHGKFWNDRANADWLESGKAIMDRFLEQGGKRAVFAGSCAEYDWRQIDQRRLQEDAPLAPHTAYGRAKVELHQHMARLVQQGASLSWGRLFFLYGPHETPTRFVPSIILALLKDETAKMSPGAQIRDFMHSVDAGRAFAALYAAPSVTGAVNVADGNAHTLLQIANELREIIGRGNVDNEAYEMRSDEPEFLVADTTRLLDEVKFSPHYDLRTGLDNCITWWRDKF